MPLSSPHISFAISRPTFFTWNSVGLYLGFMGWQCAHTYQVQ